jgi:putative transposase
VPGLAHLAGHDLPPPLPTADQPAGPAGPMPDAALVEAIRAVLCGSPFHGEGHRKLWARLRIAGVRTSKRRVLRLMREHGLLAPRASARRGGHATMTAPSSPTG